MVEKAGRVAYLVLSAAVGFVGALSVDEVIDYSQALSDAAVEREKLRCELAELRRLLQED